MPALNAYSQLFHEATGLNLVLCTLDGTATQWFKHPLIAPLREPALKAQAQHAQAKIRLTSMPEIGTVASFKLASHVVIIWAPTSAIHGNGAYEDKVPLVDYHQFQAAVKLFVYGLTDHMPESLEQTQAFSDYAMLDRLPTVAKNPTHASHAGYLSEQAMLLGVEHGNLEEFNRNYQTFMHDGNFGDLASSDLRSKKNLTIAATTLFTRAAIRGGMFAEDAYTLSDKVIKESEKRAEITNVYEYTRTIGERFAMNVLRIKRNNLPAMIYATQEYIYDHLQAELSIATLAKHAGCSASYLMHLFKETTGNSITQFILNQRVTSAKQMLIFSQASIAEIAELLGYRDQAQFARAFKQATQETPSGYRRDHQR